MTELPNLAQALLTREPQASDLQKALSLLHVRLHETPEHAVDFDIPWQITPPGIPAPTEQQILRAFSVIQALDLAWISRIAHPALGHEPVPLLLFRIYCTSLQQRSDDSNRSTMSVRDPLFFEHPAYPETAIETAVCLLALMHHPLQFEAEALGVTLAYLHRMHPQDLQNPKLESNRRTGTQALQSAIDQGLDLSRIRRGYHLYRMSAHALAQSFIQADSHSTRRLAFARVIQQKAAQGKGYHRNIKLKGRPLESWLETASTGQPEELLKAMETSPEGNGRCPLASRFLKAMEFGGPMFGIFDEDERHLAREWLEAPEAKSETLPLWVNAERKSRSRLQDPSPSRKPSPCKDPRSLYTQLLSVDSSESSRPGGLRLIRNILGKTRALTTLHLFESPIAYEAKALRLHIENLHQRALKTSPPPFFFDRLSRSDWTWLLLQLSPAILVDGAWLYGTCGVPGLVEPWQHDLIQIFEDEIGRGDPAHNHANVQRKLIQSLGYPLHDFRSKAFSHDPRFLDSAFILPCYLLALSKHSLQFEPEILGLNLAIELSGLGRGYQTVIEALEKHQIDPLIVRLHLSIDNLGSGHAQKAVNAIIRYLETLRRKSGASEVKSAYGRIHQGYLSYRVALFRFGWAVAGHLLQKRIHCKP